MLLVFGDVQVDYLPTFLPSYLRAYQPTQRRNEVNEAFNQPTLPSHNTTYRDSQRENILYILVDDQNKKQFKVFVGDLYHTQVFVRVLLLSSHTL